MQVLLIDRIDRMTNTMQRHTTGHYIRGYGGRGRGQGSALRMHGVPPPAS